MTAPSRPYATHKAVRLPPGRGVRHAAQEEPQGGQPQHGHQGVHPHLPAVEQGQRRDGDQSGGDQPGPPPLRPREEAPGDGVDEGDAERAGEHGEEAGDGVCGAEGPPPPAEGEVECRGVLEEGAGQLREQGARPAAWRSAR